MPGNFLRETARAALNIRVVRKLQFLNNFLIKSIFAELKLVLARKNAGLVSVTDHETKLTKLSNKSANQTSAINRTSGKYKMFFGGFFASALILFSCKTISTVEPVYEKPVSFETVGKVKPVWQPVNSAVDFFHGKIKEPVLEFWALRINIDSPGGWVVVKGGGGVKQNLSVKVSSFTRDNNLTAGINAVPFDIASTKEGQVLINMGIVISNGRLLSPPNPRYDALVFNTDGTMAIVSQSSIKNAQGIKDAVGGFHLILKDSQPLLPPPNRLSRHPRSAAGISGGILYLLVIDGKRRSSIGATETETAEILRALGGKDGINLDGGGSSALALRFPDGTTRAVNKPVHNNIPGTERAVAACLGVY
jgi:hypothetical protein